jgi:hypothetical protein
MAANPAQALEKRPSASEEKPHGDYSRPGDPRWHAEASSCLFVANLPWLEIGADRHAGVGHKEAQKARLGGADICVASIDAAKIPPADDPAQAPEKTTSRQRRRSARRL